MKKIKFKIIIITGTPCTGKTTLAKKLAEKLKYKLIDVNRIIKKYKLYEIYDKERDTLVVDIKKLNNVLIKEINKHKNKKTRRNGMLIDSHLSHYLPKKYADLCIVTKCSLKELEKRLKKRRYNTKKIRENLDCEIFDVCLTEAEEQGHKVVIVNTDKKINRINTNKLIKLIHGL